MSNHLIRILVADMVPARLVLYMLSFTGFLVSFMMRSDINMAIVAMVKLRPPVRTSENVTTSRTDQQLNCFAPSTNIPVNDSSVNSSSFVVSRLILHHFSVKTVDRIPSHQISTDKPLSVRQNNDN